MGILYHPCFAKDWQHLDPPSQTDFEATVMVDSIVSRHESGMTKDPDHIPALYTFYPSDSVKVNLCNHVLKTGCGKRGSF